MEYEPKDVRPRDGWVLVLAEPRKEKLESGIFLPGHETGVEKVTEGAGLVIRAGPGEKNVTLGLETGMRILYRGFLKHANPVPTEDKWESGEEKRYFILSSEDVLAVVPNDLDVGIFSGRPQVPELKEVKGT